MRIQKLIFVLSFIILSGCSNNLVSKKHRPDFENVIDSSNKKVALLNPNVVVHFAKDNHTNNLEASKYLETIVYNSASAVLNEIGYQSVDIFDNSKEYPDEIVFLKTSLEKDVKIYIQDNHIDNSLVSKENSVKLNENFGESAVKLGRYFNADLILGVRYRSLFYTDPQSKSVLLHIVDAMANSGFTKKELYSCYIVLIDTKTGNVLYSDALHQDRGFLSITEKDLFKPGYHKQIVELLKLAIPKASSS